MTFISHNSALRQPTNPGQVDIIPRTEFVKEREGIHLSHRPITMSNESLKYTLLNLILDSF
jgi:hypothetical protein